MIPVRSIFPGPAYRTALLAFAGVLAVLVTLHYDAAARAVQLWTDSPTYSFAYLIVPLSAYLVVHKLGGIAPPRVAPLPWVMLLQLPIAALWYVAVMVEVIEIQQFCLLGAVYVAILAIFGWDVVRTNAVALMLLVFLVPSGQFAIALLQDSSAVLAVLMLRLIGVPVFLDGWVVQLPTSSYFVAPGCAGLNFVLVAIVLALVVGELFYNNLGKRIAVLIGLLAMALIANPIRIFAIIAIDWATNQTTDIVSDHLTYGWAFFAVVLAICLPIAVRFRDDLPGTARAAAPAAPLRLKAHLATAAALGVVLGGAIPIALFSTAIARTRPAETLPALPTSLNGVPGAREPWRRLAPATMTAAAAYVLPTGVLRLEATLHEVAVPNLRLLDRFPPPHAADPHDEEDAPRPLGTAAIAAGELGLFATNDGGEPRVWAVCYLVDGRCLPNGGQYRRAVLKSLPGNPTGRAAIVMASERAGAAGAPGEAKLRLLEAISAAVQGLAPVAGKP